GGGECVDQAVDGLAGVHLGHGKQHAAGQALVDQSEIVTADDAVLVEQDSVDLGRGYRQRRDELLEKVLLRSLRIDYDAGDVADAGGGIVALVVAELGNAPETVL